MSLSQFQSPHWKAPTILPRTASSSLSTLCPPLVRHFVCQKHSQSPPQPQPMIASIETTMEFAIISSTIMMSGF